MKKIMITTMIQTITMTRMIATMTMKIMTMTRSERKESKEEDKMKEISQIHLHHPLRHQRSMRVRN